MTTFLITAFLLWVVRKVWKWVQKRCAEIDYENAYVAGLRKSIQNGEIEWPPS